MTSYLWKIQNRLHFYTWRGNKYVRQMIASRDAKPAPLFLIGCQRSGTNMNIEVLDKSYQTWVYNEANHKAFYNFRIKSLAVRQPLIRRAHCPWVVFKPICDSQNIDVLLSEHPDARVIWDFRRYQDVANSAVKRWGAHQLDLIRRLAEGETKGHFFFDRVTPEQRQFVQELYHDEMSPHTAAALFWYLRNRIFFDHGLEKMPNRVKLVRYEDSVSDPAGHYKTLFDSLGIEFRPAFVAEVHPSSISKQEFPAIDAPVEKLCEEMMDKLNGALEANL